MKELPTSYDHKSAEERIYRLWEESGFFNPDKLPGERKEPFTIIMPPPNANGPLHVGHALFVTIEDIMIRYARMRGKKTLWLPGADHAGFETQVVFDKKLEKEGRNRFQIPREQLWQEIWEFTQKNKSVMEQQLRKLGASCDWSREKFTLDPKIIEIVHETFRKLYDDGLVYRAAKLVNWCAKHQTTLSDLEIKHEEREDKLYYVKYAIKGEKIPPPAGTPFLPAGRQVRKGEQSPTAHNYIVVATTRPETIPADVAIAIHPKSRWKKLAGKIALNPINGRDLPIIFDKRVDLNFGTGAVKITPLHDPLDWEIYNDHKEKINTEPLSTIDSRGKLNENAGASLSGLKVPEARLKAAELLKDKFEKDPEPYKHQVAICYKCGGIIEPILKTQWFVKMTEPPKSGKKSLRDLAIEAIKTKQIRFVTKKFEKIFLHWMKNLRDWNISRQIVWGIQIPAWFCKTNKQENNFVISTQKPRQCPICGKCEMEQDPDVFDTWFSSGQWPFAALMADKSGKDFDTFYPTSVMETGHDILFFWVARMIMLGIYRTGKIPFETVYLHGLVRDKEKQKMSKSKGNAVDPLGIAETYGADALRMALIVGTTAGNDPILSEDKVRGYRNFATKIWNVGRFALMNYKENRPVRSHARDFVASPKDRGAATSNGVKLSKEDKKNIAELKAIKKKVSGYLDKYDFHHAAETLYHYFWHTFADKIIESLKHRLTSQNENDRLAAQTALLTILAECLKMLHPFMPFVTEEIYQLLPIENKNLLMVTQWL